jgi:hypothetical protein
MHITTRSLLLLALAAPAIGQNDFALDKTTPGALGAPITLRVSAAPANSALFYALSTTGGPTPIALVDAADSRSLSVGVDLINEWYFALTDGAGQSTLALTVPNDTAFVGLTLHWQSFTFPGASTLLGQISNDVVTQCGPSGTATTGPSALIIPRAFATAFAGQGAGNVLIAGGGGGTLTSSTGLATTEQFDFRRLAAPAGPTMNSARALHQAITLADGRVLVCGGADALGAVLSTCEIYDPATNSFTPTGSMLTPRVLHAAVRLADGRVLVAGGTSSLLDAVSTITNVRNSTEVYNPATGTWSVTANLGGFRMLPSLSLLPNGRVLAAGGLEVSFLFGIPLSAGTTASCQTYNPATNSWAAAAAMPGARTGHQFNQITLQNGRVLMTGGMSVSVNITTQVITTTPLTNACYYDQPTNTWTSSTMATARSLHSATRLADGRVVVCGGAQGSLTLPVAVDGVEVYSPTTNGWASLAALPTPRMAHASALLPDGTIVLLGGQDAVGTTAAIALLRL